ncbi:trypsin domain-containing protein [Ditylenchus destructor]|uniref:Trypsin domain-containing protein n=1 Tax=Ditylenchus destructor TaxID=166010 RepID=A0AAD4NE96_9BILA|nr:trypsin domain-containing protein [Ditylenchus destructor]
MHSFAVFLSVIIASFLSNKSHTKELECGISDVTSPNERVIGGKICERGELPWIVSVEVRSFFRSALCTASIISNRHLLFASHCVARHDPRATTRVSNKVYVHPDRNADIAIIELPLPLKFNEYIRQICLKKTYNENTYNTRAMISGYGIHEWIPCSDSKKCKVPRSAFDGKLRKGTSQILTLSQCQREYGNELLPKAHLCARGEEGTDVFIGDSGGPIVIENPKRDDGKTQWMQVGITSFTVAAGFQEYPTVFTRVTSYCDWIASVTKNAAKCVD